MSMYWHFSSFYCLNLSDMLVEDHHDRIWSLLSLYIPILGLYHQISSHIRIHFWTLILSTVPSLYLRCSPDGIFFAVYRLHLRAPMGCNAHSYCFHHPRNLHLMPLPVHEWWHGLLMSMLYCFHYRHPRSDRLFSVVSDGHWNQGLTICWFPYWF